MPPPVALKVVMRESRSIRLPGDVKLADLQPGDKASMLNAARMEMYQALTIYQTRTRHTLTLLVSLLAASILAFAGRGSGSFLIFGQALATFLLLMAAFIGVVSIAILTQSYMLYISTLFYAAQLYSAFDIEGPHWVERAIAFCASKYRPTPPWWARLALTWGDKWARLPDDWWNVRPQHFRDFAEAIKDRTWSRRDSHYIYTVCVGLLSIAAFIFAIVIAVIPDFP